LGTKHSNIGENVFTAIPLFFLLAPTGALVVIMGYYT